MMKGMYRVALVLGLAVFSATSVSAAIVTGADDATTPRATTAPRSLAAHLSHIITDIPRAPERTHRGSCRPYATARHAAPHRESRARRRR